MSQKSNNLNPSASEFVPSFTVPNMSSLSLSDNQTEKVESTYQQQDTNNYPQNYQQQNVYQSHHQQNHYHHGHNNHNNNNNNNQGERYYGQNYNNSHRHTYNPNYRGNNHNPNYRGNNHNPNYRGNNHRHYNNHHNNHNNGYHYQQQQQGYDVDAVELEARCEAVIEILQDDKIRDQLNPSSKYENDVQQQDQQAAQQGESNNNEELCDDEEDMMEMMAMQEECRLEMMKFYIQSQNPTLFEEIYHDVSYPDAASKKVPEEELRSAKTVTQKPSETPAEENAPKDDTLKELLINELNPDVDEFVPNKFANDAEKDN